ncbi:Protein phosphatase Slingshot 3 [Balamuthia mandrillaris]
MYSAALDHGRKTKANKKREQAKMEREVVEVDLAEIPREVVSEILLDHLYLGNARAASNKALLQKLNIQYITTSELPNFFEKSDASDQVKEEGRRVLVHCQVGIRRSASIMISYLMQFEGMDLRTAFFQVKQRKPNIGPNKGYMKQLVELDKYIFGSASFEEYYVEALISMGCERNRAVAALKEAQGNVELAIATQFLC